jgi:hypothetical protein
LTKSILHEFAVDDQHLVYLAADAIGVTGSLILAWKPVFIDPLERCIVIRDDLPASHDPDHRACSADKRRQLAPACRRDEETDRGVPIQSVAPAREWGTISPKISRRDFGIEFNVPLHGGGILVGDEAKIAIDAQAVRQG